MKEVIRICIFGILLILTGCRSESLVEADELYREQIDKIKFFENYEKDKNHRYDEKWLNYEDTSNPAIPFSQSLKTLLVNRPEVAEVIKKHYGEIYWEATSVLMESEEGDKVVYYPIIGKGKDKNKYVLKSIVNKNHTYLRFEIQTKEKEKLASQMIDDFSKYLNDDEVMESRCVDRNGIPTCDIDAVEIIRWKDRYVIKPPLPAFGFLPPANPPYYWDVGEGRYVGIECMNIGGCGGSLPLPIPPMDNGDPCEKIKEQRNDSEFTNNIGRLKKNVGLDTETGYIQRTNGVYEYKDNAKSVGNSRSLYLPNLSSNKDISGYMHTHIDDYDDEDIGIKIFSPSDVIYFLGMLKNAEKEGRNIGDVYAIMVSSEGVYQIRFSESQIGNLKTSYSATEISSLQKDYIRYMRNFVDSNARLELGFLRFLKNKMNIQNVSLYKMNNNGSNTKIKLDSNEKVSRDNC